MDGKLSLEPCQGGKPSRCRVPLKGRDFYHGLFVWFGVRSDFIGTEDDEVDTAELTLKLIQSPLHGQIFFSDLFKLHFADDEVLREST
ncbi:MAG: hypothetical protein ACRDAX_01065 [Propionibacteriaceae bacterium]